MKHEARNKTDQQRNRDLSTADLAAVIEALTGECVFIPPPQQRRDRDCQVFGGSGSDTRD